MCHLPLIIIIHKVLENVTVRPQTGLKAVRRSFPSSRNPYTITTCATIANNSASNTTTLRDSYIIGCLEINEHTKGQGTLPSEKLDLLWLH